MCVQLAPVGVGCIEWLHLMHKINIKVMGAKLTELRVMARSEVSIELLLCARHWARCLELSGKQDRHGPCPHGVTFQWGDKHVNLFDNLGL